MFNHKTSEHDPVFTLINQGKEPPLHFIKLRLGGHEVELVEDQNRRRARMRGQLAKKLNDDSHLRMCQRLRDTEVFQLVFCEAGSTGKPLRGEIGLVITQDAAGNHRMTGLQKLQRLMDHLLACLEVDRGPGFVQLRKREILLHHGFKQCPGEEAQLAIRKEILCPPCCVPDDADCRRTA